MRPPAGRQRVDGIIWAAPAAHCPPGRAGPGVASPRHHRHRPSIALGERAVLRLRRADRSSRHHPPVRCASGRPLDPSRRGPAGHGRPGGAAPARLRHHPDRRPPVGRAGRRGVSLPEDTRHRPHRARGRAVPQRVRGRPAVLPQPGQPPDGPVSPCPRDHRQHRPQRPELRAEDVPGGDARGGLRDRVHREVAHGERPEAAAGLRHLGLDARPGGERRPRPLRGRPPGEGPRVRHRHLHGPGRLVHPAAARSTLPPLLAAQGRSPQRRPARRRQPGRPRRRRDVHPRPAPPAALCRRHDPPAPQRPRRPAGQAGPHAPPRWHAAAGVGRRQPR